MAQQITRQADREDRAFARPIRLALPPSHQKALRRFIRDVECRRAQSRLHQFAAVADEEKPDKTGKLILGFRAVRDLIWSHLRMPVLLRE